MIYLPIELQLQMIQEDIRKIMSCICPWEMAKFTIRTGSEYPNSPGGEMVCPACMDCLESQSFGANSCAKHAPEFNNVITLKPNPKKS